MTIRQMNMLEQFMRRAFSYDAALELNQLTFGSLCYQQWVDWDVNREWFSITEEGKEIFRVVQAYTMERKTNTGELGQRAQSRLGYRRIRSFRKRVNNANSSV